MSWMKGTQSGAPPPGPERPPYGAPQPYGNQQNMYNNYQSTPANLQQQQQQQPQMWPVQQQTPQYNQQYGQVYQQQGFGSNANQFYQQQQQQPVQYNQNYDSQNYSNMPQGYQQNYYPNQVTTQQNYSQSKVNSDGWEDNWDWGWEDASKQAQKPPSQSIPVQPVSQQQVFNNANVIEESFASNDTWNWSMEDKKDTPDQSIPAPQSSEDPAMLPVESTIADNHAVNDLSSQRSASNPSSQQEEVRNLSETDVVKKCLPNLAMGKRINLENLTPQWSIESQMSQESSDGPLTQSEGTYRSENQSRNSNKSSPGLNTDTSNFNYSQSGYDDVSSQNIDWSKHSDEPAVINNTDMTRKVQPDDLMTAMHDMKISHAENTGTRMNNNSAKPESNTDFNPRTSQSPANLYSSESQIPAALVSAPLASTSIPHLPVSSAPQQSTANFIASSTQVVPPAVSNNNPVSSSGAPPLNNFSVNPPSIPQPSFPPSSSTPSMPPPANFPASQNPFKNAGPFSHKNIAKAPASNMPVAQSFPVSISNSNSSLPAPGNKTPLQSRIPVGFGANLETTPDNSERPDQPQVSSYRPMPVSQQVPDNLEIAPQNDRNEYLQTAHLSSSDYGENTDFSRDGPLPSLRRMGVGQQDSEYNQNLNISGDEPPPGLARMVPGQQTEADHSFSQSNDNYMDRQIDGQPTDINRRPYRQADGQQTPDNYVQPPTSRGGERRPIGLDRMVPGEPSNAEFLQYQNPNYSNSNEQRVVTGVDHDYPIPAEAGHSDVREQNVDGSDYTEQTIRNPSREILGAREVNDTSPDYSPPIDEQQREVTMEGENLQDLSVISSSDASYARDPTFDGANADSNDGNKDRTNEGADSVECLANNSRRQSLNRGTSGEDSERDRTFRSSPRRDKEKRKSSRENDRDRDRDRERARDRDKEGRYSRSDRKYERDPDRRSVRDDRRSDKDRKERDRDHDRERDRRERGDSPDSRRHRRRGHRYETEDTDYYSDKERERRRYREGSHKSSKPPRPDDKDRRNDERDRNRRYNTIERDRRYDDERDGHSRSRREERHRERYERGYRDIDPTRKYGNLRREREEEERRRVVTFSGDAKSGSSNAQAESYSSPSRAGSRGPGGTDEEPPAERRRSDRAERDERRRARSMRPDPYYEAYGGGAYDPYALQRRQYEYYERLRRTDPAAYMRLYKQLMAGRAPLDQRALNMYSEGYASMGYEGRGEERGSVHSGRSSNNGLKGNDTYAAWYAGGAGAARGAASLLTDFSDRELTTDASLNLHLEESTVRSERMTPFKFSTAHIKGSMSARALVVVRAAYPVDGLPATVQLLPLAALLARDPHVAELQAYPGPLVKGVTHKKSVLDYCNSRARAAAAGGARDSLGLVLLWQLLALLLRQNGVVVGTDIAELLMKNTQEFEYKTQQPSKPAPKTESRRTSSACGEGTPEPTQPVTEPMPQVEESSAQQLSGVNEKEALDRFREYLIYGNRQEALEWAMSSGLWGHALALAAHCGKRARAAVATRFQAALPPSDPLHTLYATLAARCPPAATCVADERWGDWRPHAAIILSNESAKPDQDRRTLTQLGDTLSSRGLLYSAQFCYVAGGVPLAPHPLAPLSPPMEPGPPPRLALLLADPRAPSLAAFATNQAIFATEVYEYALSLTQDYVINELVAYKMVMCTRLAEAGLCERALRYAEQAARALALAPRAFPPALVHRVALLADRLKYFDPALQEEGEGGEGGEEGAGGAGEGSSEPSPRHQQWLADVSNIARQLSAEASQHTTPQHQVDASYATQHQYNAWADQTMQHHQMNSSQFPEPTDEAVDYSAHYYAQSQPPAPPAPSALPGQPSALQGQPSALPGQPSPAAPGAEAGGAYAGYGDEWQRADDTPAHQPFTDYWQTDHHYGYHEGQGGAEEAAPTITMPGAAPRNAAYHQFDDRPPSADQGEREREESSETNKASKGDGKSDGKDGKGSKGDSRGKEEARRGGWLGGFLTKLALRPPNQMILPDDKNPTIVWDEARKCWRNTDADADDDPARTAPPPPQLPAPAAPALSSTSTPLQSPGAPPAAPVSNMFKMQKSRHIKKSYVDVFNPGGAAPPAPAPPPALLPPAPAPAPQAYFVPAPALTEVSMPSSSEDSPLPTPVPLIAQGGIYDPSQVGGDDEPYRGAI